VVIGTKKILCDRRSSKKMRGIKRLVKRLVPANFLTYGAARARSEEA
jgi:hypothetical protein